MERSASSSTLIAGLWRRAKLTSRNQAQRGAGEFGTIIFAAGLTLPRARRGRIEVCRSSNCSPGRSTHPATTASPRLDVTAPSRPTPTRSGSATTASPRLDVTAPPRPATTIPSRPVHAQPTPEWSGTRTVERSAAQGPPISDGMNRPHDYRAGPRLDRSKSTSPRKRTGGRSVDQLPELHECAEGEGTPEYSAQQIRTPAQQVRPPRPGAAGGGRSPLWHAGGGRPPQSRAGGGRQPRPHAGKSRRPWRAIKRRRVPASVTDSAGRANPAIGQRDRGARS